METHQLWNCVLFSLAGYWQSLAHTCNGYAATGRHLQHSVPSLPVNATCIKNTTFPENEFIVGERETLHVGTLWSPHLKIQQIIFLSLTQTEREMERTTKQKTFSVTFSFALIEGKLNRQVEWKLEDWPDLMSWSWSSTLTTAFSIPCLVLLSLMTPLSPLWTWVRRKPGVAADVLTHTHTRTLLSHTLYDHQQPAYVWLNIVTVEQYAT